MEPKIILTADNHSQHGKQFIFPVSASKSTCDNSHFCLKCGIRQLQSPRTFSIDKCLIVNAIITNLTDPYYPNMVDTVNDNIDITISLLLTLLDVPETETDTLTELKTEGSVQLLSSLQGEGSTWVTLDAILPRVFKSENRATIATTLNLLTKLIERVPTIVNYFNDGNNGHCYVSFFCLAAFVSNDEEIQQLALFILAKLVVCGISLTQPASLPTIIGQLLETLHSSSNKDIQRQGMDLLKGMMTDRGTVEIMMAVKVDDATLPTVLKRYLLANDKRTVIVAVQCVLIVLNCNQTNYAKILLDHQLGTTLLETLNNVDEILVELTMSCCLFLTEERQFFFKCLAVYGIDVIVRAMETALSLHRTNTLCIAYRLLCKIFERQPGNVVLMNSRKKVLHVLNILKRGIEEPFKNISLMAITALSYVLRRDRLCSPVPFKCIEEALQSMASVLAHLTSEPCLEGSQQQFDQTTYSDFILETYLNIHRKTLKLCEACGQDPTSLGATFEVPQFAMSQEELYQLSSQEILNSQRLLNSQSSQRNILNSSQNSQRNMLINSQNSQRHMLISSHDSSNSQSSQNIIPSSQNALNSQQQMVQSSQNSQRVPVQDSSLEQLRNFVFKELDETMIPLLLSRPECFRNSSISLSYFDCLHHLLSSGRSAESVHRFAIKLISTGSLHQMCQISSYFSSSSQSQTKGGLDIFNKRNSLLSLVFNTVDDSTDETLMSKLEVGFQYLKGSPSVLVHVLNPGHLDEVQTSVLALNYYSLLNNQIFNSHEELLPALCNYITTHKASMDIWSLKFSLYLMAECYFKMEPNDVGIELRFVYEEAVQMLLDQLQHVKDYSSIYTPKKLFIRWIFSIDNLHEQLANDMLHHSLFDSRLETSDDQHLFHLQMLDNATFAKAFLNCLGSTTTTNHELRAKCYHLLGRFLDHSEAKSSFLHLLFQRIPFILSMHLFQQNIEEEFLLIILSCVANRITSEQKQQFFNEDDSQIQDYATFHHLIKLVPLVWSDRPTAVLQQIFRCISLFLSKFHLQKDNEGVQYFLSDRSIVDIVNQILSTTSVEANLQLYADIFIIMAIAIKYKTMQQLKVKIDSSVLRRALFASDPHLVLSTIHICKMQIEPADDEEATKSKDDNELKNMHWSLLNLLIKHSKNSEFINEIFSYFVRMVRCHPKLGKSLIFHKWTTVAMHFLLKTEVQLTPNFIRFCKEVKQMDVDKDVNWDAILNSVSKRCNQ